MKKENNIFRRIIPKTLIVILLISCNQGDKNNASSDFPSPSYISKDLLKQDLDDFVAHFRSSNFKFNRISWTAKSGSYQLSNEISEEHLPLIFAEKEELPKKTLDESFDLIFYYLDQVRINKNFNNKPIPPDVLAFIGDFLRGKYGLRNKDMKSTFLSLRTHSSILRLIEGINDPNELPPELIRKYGNMPFDKIKLILTRSAYDEVAEKFYKLQDNFPESAYSVDKCVRYWPIAPLMKLDTRYKEEIKKLEGLAKEVHGLLNNPKASPVGILTTHLACVETIEETIGRSPDPSTGEGLLDAYVKYIANNLWDYPLYFNACGPFRGVMGKFTKLPDGTNNYCRENFKSVSDNLYLAYLLRRYGVRDDLLVDYSALQKDGRKVSKIAKVEADLNRQLLGGN